MPRTNRPRRRTDPGTKRGRQAQVEASQESDGLDRLRAGWRRTETQRGHEWNVQPISESRATKTYLCPGCGLGIDTGVAHLVVWRADGLLGDQADVAARRHWHEHCWRIAGG